jgi:hypothetical protein
MRGLRIATYVLAAVVSIAGIGGTVSAAEVAFRDDFDALDLGAGWQVLDENTETYSLSDRAGFFRVQTERGRLDSESGVANLLVRDVAGDFIIETMLEFDPHAAVHYGGLLVYADDAIDITDEVIRRFNTAP